MKIKNKIDIKFKLLGIKMGFAFNVKHFLIVGKTLSLLKRPMDIFKIAKLVNPDLVTKVRYNRNKLFKVKYYNDSTLVNLLSISYYEKEDKWYRKWKLVEKEEYLIGEDDLEKEYKESVTKYYNKNYDEIITISQRNKKIQKLLNS